MVCWVLEPNFPSDGEIDSGWVDCRRIGDIQSLENAKRGKGESCVERVVCFVFLLFFSFLFFVRGTYLLLLLFPLFWGALFGKRERKKESMVWDEKEREGRGIKEFFFLFFFAVFRSGLFC